MNKKIHVVKIAPKEKDTLEIIAALAGQLEIEGIEELDDRVDVYVEHKLLESKEWIELESLFRTSYSAKIEHAPLENKNWNKIWEAEFVPIYVHDFAYIRAPFHEMNNTAKYDLVIQPKMSFGTGHHATTYLMISMLEHLSVRYKKVLDLGSGTAILAILAKKMNAEKVLALDNDAWCFENGQENAQLNNVGIDIVLGEIDNVKELKFDVILANINRNYFLERMTDVVNLLAENGQIVMSGFLSEDVAMIGKVAQQNQIRLNAIREKDGWVCLVGEKI